MMRAMAAGDATICPSLPLSFNDTIDVRKEQKLMKMPAMFSGDSITRLLQGAAVGVVGTLVVGFGWGGWTLGSTAEQMASERATTAVVKVLAPACVQRFQAQADLSAQWAAFKKVDSWQRDGFIKKTGFATPVGSETPNGDAAEKCASLLSEILEKQDKQANKS